MILKFWFVSNAWVQHRASQINGKHFPIDLHPGLCIIFLMVNSFFPARLEALVNKYSNYKHESN